MAIYSKNGNYPTDLPDRIRLSNGKTRTDKTTFTSEEISDAGYVQVNDRPANPTDKPFYSIEWNYDTLDWNIRISPNEEEIATQWNIVRGERDSLLIDADLKLHISIEEGLDDPWISPYKNALRNIPDDFNDPFNITWPVYGNPYPSGNEDSEGSPVPESDSE